MLPFLLRVELCTRGEGISYHFSVGEKSKCSKEEKAPVEECARGLNNLGSAPAMHRVLSDFASGITYFYSLF